MFKKLEHRDSFKEKEIYKVIIIGDSSCGKTSISQKYSKNYFSENESNTIGVAYLTKQFENPNTGKTTKICFWDTAGQERYFSIVKLYFKNARGIICVYDINNINTLKNCHKWLSQAKEYLNDEKELDIPIVLVGNKCDLLNETSNNEKIRNSLIEEYKSTYNVAHFITSAKTGENIENMMNHLLSLMVPNQVQEKDSIYIGNNNEPNPCICG